MACERFGVIEMIENFEHPQVPGYNSESIKWEMAQYAGALRAATLKGDPANPGRQIQDRLESRRRRLSSFGLEAHARIMDRLIMVDWLNNNRT